MHGKNTDSGVPQTPWVWPCHCLPPTGTSQGFLLGKMRRDKPIWKHGCDYKPRFCLKGLAQGLAHSRHTVNGRLDLGLGSPPTVCRSLDLPLPAPSSPWLLVLRGLDLVRPGPATPLLPGGACSSFLSTLAAPGCLLQAHFTQQPTPGKLWFCHIPSYMC